MQFRSKQSVSTIEPSEVGVLLLHGLTGMPSEMRPLAKRLKREGYVVSTPMLAGHGATHKELLATGCKDWIEGTKLALIELNKTCKKVFVGGLSMGALLSVILAADNSTKVDGLFLMSCTLEYDGRMCGKFLRRTLLPFSCAIPFLHDKIYWTEEPPYGLKDARLQRIITQAMKAAESGESDHFGLFRTYVGTINEMNKVIKESKLQASRVTCPTIILHSLEDSLTTIKNALTMHDLIGSDKKDVVTLMGCDHVLTLDLQKEKVSHIVSDFIKSELLNPSSQPVVSLQSRERVADATMKKQNMVVDNGGQYGQADFLPA
jgi:carboxylesterase